MIQHQEGHHSFFNNYNVPIHSAIAVFFIFLWKKKMSCDQIKKFLRRFGAHFFNLGCRLRKSIVWSSRGWITPRIICKPQQILLSLRFGVVWLQKKRTNRNLNNWWVEWQRGSREAWSGAVKLLHRWWISHFGRLCSAKVFNHQHCTQNKVNSGPTCSTHKVDTHQYCHF